MIGIIAPKAPRAGCGWVRRQDPPAWVSLGYDAACWFHPDTEIAVISAVEVAKDADGIDRGPEYHISISLAGTARCTSQQAVEVLRHFDLDGAEEDNHVRSGIVRNFWRPVADRFVGLQCACKDSEPAIVEDKGDFTWRDAPEAQR